jgi:RHS repeat-associated protein
LKLQYASQVREEGSPFGYGWSLNIPYIQRLNKTGSDRLYADNYFTSSLSGELVLVSGTTYASRVENGDFLKYNFDGTSWTVTDKNGTVYKFGAQAATRQDKPGDSTQVFKWMLEETRDTNNNYITYQYFKDGGQIYPSKIIYTGNGITAGIFQVEFFREARTDIVTSDTPGFTVVSNYRINTIQAEVNGSWVRKYSIAYTASADGARSLINTITESGQDTSLNITTLPPTSFNYQGQGTAWNQSSPWAVPLPFMYTSTNLNWTELADVNGDGLTDELFSGYEWNPATTSFVQASHVYLNNGSGWTLNSSWTIPEVFQDVNFNDVGTRLADVNGDGLTDILFSGWEWDPTTSAYVWHNRVWLNTGSGWTLSTSWTIPVPFILCAGSCFKDNGVRIADVNGDGLPDIIQAPWNQTPNVYINTGSGWALNANWVFPSTFTFSTNNEQATTFADVNGDGLNDVLFSGYDWVGTNFVPVSHVWINTGSSWVLDNSWSIPELFEDASYSDLGTRMVDINGDGLADILSTKYVLVTDPGGSTHYDPVNKVYINNGTGWTYDSGWAMPIPIMGWTGSETDNGTRIADVNGDGLPDFLYGPSNLPSAGYSNNSPKIDLLSRISYRQGGRTDIAYKPSAQYMNGSAIANPNLPMILDTVNQITTSDGAGLSGTDTYSYQGGSSFYNTPTDHKFAGFATIIRSDPAGNISNTFFHQGNASDSTHGEFSDDYSKIGKIYRVEQYDNSGHLFAKTINKWDDAALSTGSTFVKLAQTLNSSYDGGATHKDKAESYTYDNTTGNQTQKTEYGQVNGSDDGTFTDSGSDLFTTTYAYTSGGSIVGLPDDVTTTDQNSNKVKESKYFYDGSITLGSVTKGNLTEQDDWKSGTNYITHKKSYDGTYGLVTQELDPNNNATNYSFDSFHLYQITVTNALNQATHYTYDYQSGKTVQTTDVNGLLFTNTYDGLSRLTLTKQPDLTTPSTPVTKTSYAYTDTSNAVSVAESDYMDGSNAQSQYTYFDGLGRMIQLRKSAEDSGNFNVKDFSYNTLGLLSTETLPYVSTGSPKTSANTTAALNISYGYDALGRNTTTTNTLGTTASAYSPWQLSTTDPNSHTKDLINDAYGNLIQVNEHNGANTYITAYAYDYLKDLTKITDANGNIRNFTYDGLGRRLTAQDLHTSAATSFGTWTYAYDNAGNLTQKVDPNANTVNYVFDALNRETNEKLGTTTKVTYTYDTCTDGVGRLCSVTNPSLTTTDTYNALGLLATQIKNISSTNYETDYTYDRQGHQLTVKNADNSQVIYTYNLAGLPESVSRQESTDTSSKSVISNFDYSPLGEASVISFANGATTTNTFDSTKLYRLSHKVTTAGTSSIQDASYTYDPVGNIAAISDASATDTKKNIVLGYDALNRLTSYTVTGAINGNNHSETYTYDPVGNITNKSDLGNFTYGGTGLPNPDAVRTIGTTNYSYDNNGNVLTAGNQTNTWDYNNRLTQTVIGSGHTAVTITYAYDQDGQRIKYTKGSASTLYINKFYNITGTSRAKHIFANGQVIADIAGTGTSAVANSVHADSLTGANIATDGTGAIKEVLDYYPFGGSRLDEQTGANEQRKFAGHEFDADTSLSYQDARYYNSSIGRFTSEDPSFLTLGFNLSDPQSLNPYTYTRNNPIIYIDPTGNSLQQAIGNFFLNLAVPNEQAQVAVGNAAQNAYSSNAVVRVALDHPFAAGAVIGVAGAGLAYGTAAAAPAITSAAADIASTAGTGTAIKAGLGAALNVANTALSSKVEHRNVSAVEYISSGVIGAGGAVAGLLPGNQAAYQAAYYGITNSVQQRIFSPGNVDWTSVGISTVSAGLLSQFSGSQYLSRVPEIQRTFAELGLSFSFETPAQIINSGIRSASDTKTNNNQ